VFWSLIKPLPSKNVGVSLTSRPRQYFDLQTISKFNQYDIFQKIFKPELKCLYLMMISHTDKPNRILKFDLNNIENNLEAEISQIDFNSFEVSGPNPDEFYVISENVIYHTGFKLLKKPKNFNFFGFGAEKTKDLGLKEFYRSVSAIEFIRFTKDNEFFFVNEDKSIKMIQTESKEVLKIFSQHNFSVINVLFDEKLKNLYR
jgi:hypothetical protein